MVSTRLMKRKAKISVVLGLCALLVILVNLAYAQEKTTLTVTHFRGVESGMWVTDRWKSEFEEQNPGIQVEFDHCPYNELYKKVAVQFQGGKAADVTYAGPDQYGEFVRLGILEPLDPFIEKDPDCDLLEQSILRPDVTVKGKLYMMGQEIGSQNIYYNTRLLGEAGLGAPTNWEEFIQYAKKAMDPEVGIWGMTVPLHKGATGHILFKEYWPLLGSKGGYMVKEGRAAFNSPEGAEALEFLLDLDRVHQIVSPGVLSVKQRMVRQRFANEQDVFMLDANFGMPVIHKQNPDLPYETIEFFKGVTEPGLTSTGGGIGMVSTSKNKEAAWKFLRYMGSKKTLMWAGVPCAMPDRRDVLSDATFQNMPHWKPFIVGVLNHRSFSPWQIPKFSECMRYFLIAAQKVYLEMTSTREALDEAAEHWNQLGLTF